MKKISIMLSLAALTAACSKLKDNEYKVNGTVDPAWEGRTVWLEKQGMFGSKVVDTAKVKNAAFTFQDTVSEPAIYYIKVQEHPHEPITVIVEPGEIDLLVRKDTIVKSVAEGTYNNDKYAEFSDIFGKGLKAVQRFELNNQQKLDAAIRNKDVQAENKLREDRRLLLENWENKIISFIKANPKAYVNLLALSQLNQLKMKEPGELKKLFDGLDAKLKASSDGKQLERFFVTAQNEQKAVPQVAPQAGVKVGDKAPSFAAKNPEGKEISLQQSLGSKVTIIDFWASWCPPCRKENPNMVALYKKYHDKGLNIIGVSLDKTAESWKQAIQKDGLLWPQVSNLMYWDEPIAKLYGVEQIPAPFVLDASGKVIARDIYGEELEKTVEKLLK